MPSRQTIRDLLNNAISSYRVVINRSYVYTSKIVKTPDDKMRDYVKYKRACHTLEPGISKNEYLRKLRLQSTSNGIPAVSKAQLEMNRPVVDLLEISTEARKLAGDAVTVHEADKYDSLPKKPNGAPDDYIHMEDLMSLKPTINFKKLNIRIGLKLNRAVVKKYECVRNLFTQLLSREYTPIVVDLSDRLYILFLNERILSRLSKTNMHRAILKTLDALTT